MPTINVILKKISDISSLENLIYLSIIVLNIFISFLLFKYFYQDKSNAKKIKNHLEIISIKKKQFFFMWFSLLLWISYGFLLYLGYKANLLRISASLATAWFTIEYMTSIVKKSFLSKSFAFFVWSLTALYIFNVLDPAVKFAKNLSLTIGALEISLYTFISAYFIFSLLFWIVSKLEYFLKNVFNSSKHLSASQKVLYIKVAKFFLLTVAVLSGFRMIGVDVASMTLFTGAIAFGIGFGLQKVFSNLISGLILLLDKSIKPGDVIALGDTYGVVQDLEARYISIITREGKKHLIPNEILVTERVENWSYQDDKLRLKVAVGVSYDENPYEVQKILLECAKEHPRVLSDPKAVCLFVDFADSAMNFELRFWISDPVNGIGNPQSEIRLRIWEKFKEHNISIPYPHQEVIFKNTPKITSKSPPERTHL